MQRWSIIVFILILVRQGKVDSRRHSRRVNRKGGSSTQCFCQVQGDPHIITFDHGRIDFMGTCKYTLAQSTTSDDTCSFKVEYKADHEPNQRNLRVSYVRLLDVKIKGVKLRLARKKGRVHSAYIDGSVIKQFPYEDASKHFKIEVSGIWLVFKDYQCGIDVLFDGRIKGMILTRKDKYSGRMSGLCGDCNGDKRNDFLLSNGQPPPAGLSRKKLGEVIGKSYEVDDDSGYKTCKTPFRPGTSAQNGKTESGRNTVGGFNLPKSQKNRREKQKTKVVERKTVGGPSKSGLVQVKEESKSSCKNKFKFTYFTSRSLCGILLKYPGVFDDCRAKIPEIVHTKYDDCVFDACANEDNMNEAKSEACSSMTSLAIDCAEAGVILKPWRNDNLCPMHCGVNEEASQDATQCPATCEDPNPGSCDIPSREGCQCKTGFVLNQETCVKLANCPPPKCNKGFKPKGRKCVSVCDANKGEDFNVKTNKCDSTCTEEEIWDLTKKDCKPRCSPPQVWSKTKKACGPHECNPPLVWNNHDQKCLPIPKPATNNILTGKPPPTTLSAGKGCECLIEGDPHYHTYDKLHLTFQGACKYLLTKSTLPGDRCQFSVEGKNNFRFGITSVTSLDIADVTLFGIKIRLKQFMKYEINGQSHDDEYEDTKHRFMIRPTTEYLTIDAENSCGVSVEWDGDAELRIRTSGRYRGHLKGICGDCNGKASDDYRTSNGHDVAKYKKRDALVANSFLVNDDTTKNSHPKCAKPSSAAQVHCKSSKMNNFVKSAALCGMITDKYGPLKNCMQTVAYEEHFDNCYYDSCVYEDNQEELLKVACRAVQEYVTSCEEMEINYEDWRNVELCPAACPANSNLLKGASGCPATCHIQGKNAAECNLPSQDTCQCNDGFVLHQGKCITKSQCPK